MSGGFLRWWRLEADRRLVAALLVAVVPLGIVGVELLGLADLRTAITADDPVQTLFQALVAAVITGVTLVVTISQLVLSQELGPLGDQWSRLSDAMDVRERVEDHLRDVSTAAAQPSTFLRDLVRSAVRDAERLVELADDAPNELAEDLRGLGETVRDDASKVADALDDATFGTFGVVGAALELHYSPAMHRARRLLHQGSPTHGSSDDGTSTPGDPALDDEARETVERLLTTLELFAASREHVKTLYFQWDLVDLSRSIIASAIPALVTAVVVLLYFEVSVLLSYAPLGVGLETWVLAASVGVTIGPFGVLLAYMLRIVTVARRTLAIGPFVLLDDDRDLLDRGR